MGSHQVVPFLGVSACLAGSSLTSGWPGLTGSPSSTSHSMIVAGKPAVTRWLSPRISTRPSSAPLTTDYPGPLGRDR